MLFNFFQKHKNQSFVREHFNVFQDSFSTKQKEAILCSLFLIANSDDEYHENESLFFEHTAKLLGYKLSPNYLEIFLNIDKYELFEYLDSLEENQKDWYIITAFGMVNADDKILDREFQYLQVFLEKMHITEDRFYSVLKKVELLNKKFL